MQFKGRRTQLDPPLELHKSAQFLKLWQTKSTTIIKSVANINWMGCLFGLSTVRVTNKRLKQTVFHIFSTVGEETIGKCKICVMVNVGSTVILRIRRGMTCWFRSGRLYHEKYAASILDELKWSKVCKRTCLYLGGFIWLMSPRQQWGMLMCLLCFRALQTVIALNRLAVVHTVYPTSIQ